jgi:hypothetical protein
MHGDWWRDGRCGERVEPHRFAHPPRRHSVGLVHPPGSQARLGGQVNISRSPKRQVKRRRSAIGGRRGQASGGGPGGASRLHPRPSCLHCPGVRRPASCVPAAGSQGNATAITAPSPLPLTSVRPRVRSGRERRPGAPPPEALRLGRAIASASAASSDRVGLRQEPAASSPYCEPTYDRSPGVRVGPGSR